MQCKALFDVTLTVQTNTSMLVRLHMLQLEGFYLRCPKLENSTSLLALFLLPSHAPHPLHFFFVFFFFSFPFFSFPFPPDVPCLLMARRL